MVEGYRSTNPTKDASLSRADRSERSPCTKRILEYLREEEFPVPPWMIAKDLSMNPSTVRARLTDLAQEGRVMRAYRGHYHVSDPTHGVGEVRRLLIHNVALQIPGVDFSRKVEDFDQTFGDVRIHITYGKKKGLVTGSVSKDQGLTWGEFTLSVRLFLDRASKAIGRLVSMDDVLVKTEEKRALYITNVGLGTTLNVTIKYKTVGKDEEHSMSDVIPSLGVGMPYTIPSIYLPKLQVRKTDTRIIVESLDYDDIRTPSNHYQLKDITLDLNPAYFEEPDNFSKVQET